ncbi:MAG: fibronectin type III domain-containing protein [Bdellovibrionaceae bacterium]|nr:fibronectin type III domain-containing protein [Pseudobdellovibrionaceae bacterium]
MSFKSILSFALLSFAAIAFAGSPSADGSHGKNDPNNLFPPKKMNKAKSTPPKKVELIEPAFMAQVPGTSVTLKWNAVDFAENYHLQVATDATFKWLKVDDNFVKRPSYDLSQLEAGKIYYWRVAAVKNSNDPMYIKGPFETSSFETK